MKKAIFILILILTLSFISGCNPQIQSYICQIEDCKQVTLNQIHSAQESIYFMIYSFTDDQIGDALVKAHQRGIEVRGILEKQQKSQYSEFNKLKQAGIPIQWDTNSALLHHKVFIIDQTIVITGSTNPTNNGFTRNDENTIIIQDPQTTQKFLKEFTRLIQN